jgi:DNA-3-methyladenine glycosylase II
VAIVKGRVQVLASRIDKQVGPTGKRRATAVAPAPVTRAAAPIARGFDVQRARRHLARVDPALGEWMRRIGRLPHDWDSAFDPVDALARAILYQQLAGKAAATIVGRIEKHLPRGPQLCAQDLRDASHEGLRACGVSANKQRALKDLAEKALDGVVPLMHELPQLDDDALVARLTAVRGIGRWTVEMMLIFRLGRADVLPIDDLGVRRGAEILLGRKRALKPRRLAEIGLRWAPYRTLASLYLWRIADFDRNAAVKRSQD